MFSKSEDSDVALSKRIVRNFYKSHQGRFSSTGTSSNNKYFTSNKVSSALSNHNNSKVSLKRNALNKNSLTFDMNTSSVGPKKSSSVPR